MTRATGRCPLVGWIVALPDTGVSTRDARQKVELFRPSPVIIEASHRPTLDFPHYISRPTRSRLTLAVSYASSREGRIVRGGAATLRYRREMGIAGVDSAVRGQSIKQVEVLPISEPPAAAGLRPQKDCCNRRSRG